MATAGMLRDRRRQTNGPRDAARLRSVNGTWFYVTLPGESATSIARWFNVSNAAIPLLLRLPNNRRYLVKNASGVLTFPLFKGGELVRVPATWIDPTHPAHPTRGGNVHSLGDDDTPDQGGDPGTTDALQQQGGGGDINGPQGNCDAGGTWAPVPGSCPDGYHWDNSCCYPDAAGPEGPVEGSGCGLNMSIQGGVCSCNQGYIQANGQVFCVMPGEACGDDGSFYTYNGDCAKPDATAAPCCGSGTPSWMTPDCKLTEDKQLEVDNTQAPECTQYDACKDDFVPVPNCTPGTPGKAPAKGTPATSGGQPTGGVPAKKQPAGGTPAKKPAGGTTPGKTTPGKTTPGKTPAKGGAVAAEAGKGLSTGAKVGIVFLIVAAVGGGAYATRKKWMPKKG